MLKSITDAARRSIASAIESIANAIPVPSVPPSLDSRAPADGQFEGGGPGTDPVNPYGLTYIRYPGEQHERERSVYDRSFSQLLWKLTSCLYIQPRSSTNASARTYIVAP